MYRIAWMNTCTGHCGIEFDCKGTKEELEDVLVWYMKQDTEMAYWLVLVSS